MFDLIQNMFGDKSKVREESLDGVKYVVAPCAMIEEGVWEGSEGAVYYPDEENRKSARAWNHKPVVVQHPTDSAGKYISASDPEIIVRSQIGILLNTKYNTKLYTECWMDETKANRVDSRVLSNVKGGTQVETSTGLDADKEEIEGEFKGKKYKVIARNYRPDHLAILPDKLGAYSIADGGGLLANTAATLPESIRYMMSKALEKAYEQGGVVVTANELSYDERTRQLSELLREKYGKPGQYWSGHVYAVYDGWCVYCDGGYDEPYYVQKFTMKDDVVSLGGEPVEAKKVVEYVTAKGSSYAANSAGQLILKETAPVANENKIDKKGLVDSLIGKGPWVESDREALMAFEDDVLSKIVANAAPVAPPPPAPKPLQELPSPTPPATPKPQSLKEIIDNSDPRTKERFAEFERVENEIVSSLVDQIKGNANNAFAEDYLKAQPIGFLRNLAAIAAKPVEEASTPIPSYWGAAGTLANAAPMGRKPPEPLLPLSTLPEKASA